VSAARYSLVADIRDVDLSRPVRVPVDGFYRAKLQTGPRERLVTGDIELTYRGIEKCDCHAGNALIIMSACLRQQRARDGALAMSAQQQRL
jgi:hypothetical protein